MNQGKKNWREATVMPSDAVDVKSTKQLSGLSSETPGQNATNELKEYTTPKTPPGPLGAENSYS